MGTLQSKINREIAGIKRDLGLAPPKKKRVSKKVRKKRLVKKARTAAKRAGMKVVSKGAKLAKRRKRRRRY